MAKRLVETYHLGDDVEIKLGDNSWQTAVVVKRQHPGLWVRTEDGMLWFVTNSRHIRLQAN